MNNYNTHGHLDGSQGNHAEWGKKKAHILYDFTSIFILKQT